MSVLPVIGQATDEILKVDGTAFRCLVETFDFYFDEIGETSEVNKCIIEYKGTGLPNLQIEIGTRSRQSVDVTYSTPIDFVSKDGSISFFFRSAGVGKFIRFRISWDNVEGSYIEDLRFLALTKVENGADIDEK